MFPLKNVEKKDPRNKRDTKIKTNYMDFKNEGRIQI